MNTTADIRAAIEAAAVAVFAAAMQRPDRRITVEYDGCTDALLITHYGIDGGYAPDAVDLSTENAPRTLHKLARLHQQITTRPHHNNQGSDQ